MKKEFSTDITEARGFVLYLAIDNGNGYMEANVSDRRSGNVCLVGQAKELTTILMALPVGEDGWETTEELHQLIKSDESWTRFEFEKPTGDVA